MKLFKLYFILIFISVFICQHKSISQIDANSWGVSDTNLFISKSTDFGTVHDYLALYNYSGQDLQMRWVKYLDSNWPSWWGLSFTDPDNYYPDILNIDSADFILPDPVGFSNKLIIGVNHQSYAWYATAHFKVFPVLYPTDTLWLHYNIEIVQGNATAAIDKESNNFTWEFIPSINQVILQGDLINYKSFTLFNLAGQKVISLNISTHSNAHFIHLPNLNAGIYLMQIKDQSDRVIGTKKIIL